MSIVRTKADIDVENLSLSDKESKQLRIKEGKALSSTFLNDVVSHDGNLPGQG